MKMISPLYLTVMSLMVVYCKPDSMSSKDVEPRHCYQCSGSSCDKRPSGFATCPPERPYCATVAAAPNYTSSLSCAAASKAPCSLTHSAEQTLELICICTEHLCNAPFSRDLQYELIAFSAADIPKNDTDYIEMFWKQSHLVIDNDSHVYQKITMKVLATETPIRNVSGIDTSSASASLEHAQAQSAAPRAEMLKQQQQTTLPSDDDEDEGEGSGAGAEEEGPAPRRTTPAAPAAPSSYLPEDGDDNSAQRTFLTLIATIPAFFYLLV